MKRESFKSKLGIIAVAAGSAIGLGNIWKFPYITGMNGGAAFIFVYLVCIMIVGIPVMLSEFALGRKNKTNPIDSFKKISSKGKWHYTGFLAVATSFIILSFYAIIAGWVLSYAIRSLTGKLSNVPNGDFGKYFTELTSHPFEPTIATVIVLIITALIVMGGVQKGIENFSKIVMPILLLLIVVLMIRSVTLPGAKAGIEFLFKPDFSKLTYKGVLEALGHSFYTLSLGMGIILTYGSYIDENENLITLSYQVAAADTIIALLAGTIIFPAVFSFGLQPEQGPGLIFITLPSVFREMPFGSFFEFVFFILIGIAAITSTVSLMETSVGLLADKFNLSRKKSTIIITCGLCLLAIPSVLSFGPLSNVTLINGMGIFDSLDFVTSNAMLPLGGILICLFVGWIWGASKASDEISEYGRYKFRGKKLYIICIKYVAPLAILIVCLYGLGFIDILIKIFN